MLDDQEQGHNAPCRWVLFTDEPGVPELVPVVEAPRLVARRIDCTLEEAAGCVVDALLTVPRLELFELRPDGPARQWQRSSRGMISLAGSARFAPQPGRSPGQQRPEPPPPGRPGRPPAGSTAPESVQETLEQLRSCWFELAQASKSFDLTRSGRPARFSSLAIRRQVFRELFEDDVVRPLVHLALSGAAASAAAAPVGTHGQWKDSMGQYTAEAKMRMQELRKQGFSDREIAARMGINNRQTISQTIGSKVGNKARAKSPRSAAA